MNVLSINPICWFWPDGGATWKVMVWLRTRFHDHSADFYRNTSPLIELFFKSPLPFQCFTALKQEDSEGLLTYYHVSVDCQWAMQSKNHYSEMCPFGLCWRGGLRTFLRRILALLCYETGSPLESSNWDIRKEVANTFQTNLSSLRVVNVW